MKYVLFYESADEAAEEFVRDDPFILNGVVRDWQIKEWHEVLVP